MRSVGVGKRMVLVMLTVASVAACSPRLGGARDTSAEVTAAEDAFTAALRVSDTTALKSMIAPEFEFNTGDPGRPPVPRSAWLGNILFGNIKTDSIGYQELTVAAPSPDSALATMWLHWKPIIAGRAVTTDVTRVEDTWVRRNDTWQVVRRRVLQRKQPS